MSTKRMGGDKANVKKPVDGTRVHSVKECPLSVKNTQIHFIPPDPFFGRQTIKLRSKNGFTRVLIPSRVPQEKPVILPSSEFKRLKEESRIITEEEKKNIIVAAEQMKVEKSLQCEARKDLLREISSNQEKIKDSMLTQHESEAKRKTMYILQRAYELKQEQEDEVKAANRFILAAKCSAIRNAQLAEKTLIKRENEIEDKRLDAMMEQQRQLELKREEDKKKKMEEKRQMYIQEVNKQNRENELRKLMELEAKEEENRRMNEALIAIQQEEEAKLKKRHETCIKNAEEMQKVNDEMEHYKLMEREENKIADMKIAEYMRKKIQEEEAREKERLEQKKRKEMETLRQQNILQKQNDLKAKMDELQAMRIQEEHEREWRNKERKKALEEKRKEEELKQARIQQIDDLRRMQALEIARDEEDFAKTIALQKEKYENHLKEQDKRKQAEADFRTTILKQITEKESKRIKERREIFQDGEAMRLEAEMQKRHVAAVLQNKLASLKLTGLPEKYIKDVECRLKL